MVQINWTYQAKDDLKSIVDYITKDSKRYARLQVERIKMRTHSLKTQPRMGKIVQEINKPNIRELVFGNYRIIYLIVSSKQIDILTIHHSAKDLTRRKIK